MDNSTAQTEVADAKTTAPAVQAITPDEETTPSPEHEAISKAIASLKLRGIGPAVMGGRIADIAVHPIKRSTWYVAVGSGGLWKTTNAGTTWQPVFDDQSVYSIGCVTLDPSNPDIVWVGTGENVSGRHVGWGDGVYRSRNGGATWEHLGLEKSEHIGKILVDPRDDNVVLVAAEGPLWSAGGDRGLYRTADGGATWVRVLEINEHTGVTDIAFEPTNPDIVYAAAYQRRRHIWSFLGGGPSSGIHKSTDGGATWRKITQGLPAGDVGKIGLAVTAADPAIVYATVEAGENEKGESEKGFYRSTNRGESWEKRSDYISGGTGPHYYQVIEASQQNADLVYQMDVFVHVTRDGGKNFSYLETGKGKHSDNHALWIDPNDGAHLLCGTDAGLYESFDEGQTWRHFPNLPIAQFYRVALDSSEPFYNILGGAQDLGTLFGPSRTANVDGVRNCDWYVPLGADGYHVAFDPDNPDTFYLEYQIGNLFRYDRRSEELLDIQPQPAPDDPPERWNWDAPILISPHDSARVYYASQRLWRSDDRGNSWTPASDDLTANRNRYELAMMGRVWSVDALYDTGAMSQYSTISTLSESPVQEGLLYVGTDDGLIQVSEDGGQTWGVAASLPTVPAFSFIQDVEASQHDADTVFAIADAHKTGDFSPYVFESNDRGQTWRAIMGDLPENTILWTLEQDHETSNLLFLAAEFGIYVSTNGGENWFKLGGTPTIAFRDLKLQRRDNDLVGASFGRGFYVLDDYAVLRDIAGRALENDGHLFPVRDAWWYVPYTPMQARGQPTLGNTAFIAPNPPFGAVFTYYLCESALNARSTRHKQEGELREEGSDIPFPGWEQLRAEALEQKPQALLLISDADGQPARWLTGPAEEGLHRIAWDLRYPAPNPINLTKPDFVFPWSSPPQGPLAAPGKYSAQLFLHTAEGLQALGEPQTFDVKPVPTAPAETDFAEVSTFQQAAGDLGRRIAGAHAEIGRAEERLRHIRAALIETPRIDQTLFTHVDEFAAALAELKTQLSGDRIRQQWNEPTVPSISRRVGRVVSGHWGTRQSPTETQRRNIAIAERDFGKFSSNIAALLEQELPQLEAELEAAGAPWTPGRQLV